MHFPASRFKKTSVPCCQQQRRHRVIETRRTSRFVRRRICCLWHNRIWTIKQPLRFANPYRHSSNYSEWDLLLPKKP